MIASVEFQKDLGILFDISFTEVAAKTNRLLGVIRSSDHLDLDMLTILFFTLVPPTLEYCNSVWGPLFVLDQRKIEKVQRRATRLLLPIRDNLMGITRNMKLFICSLSQLFFQSPRYAYAHMHHTHP